MRGALSPGRWQLGAPLLMKINADECWTGWDTGMSGREENSSLGWQADAPGLHWDAWRSPTSQPSYSASVSPPPKVAPSWGEVTGSWIRAEARADEAQSQGNMSLVFHFDNCWFSASWWLCLPVKLQSIFVLVSNSIFIWHLSLLL